jgi:hypothetical protein
MDASAAIFTTQVNNFGLTLDAMEQSAMTEQNAFGTSG